jgi:membrane-anchored glycerophosphoryl diester phosphodiesterase (GDPDase)
MIKSLIESVLTIVKKPVVLVPGMVFILIDFFVRFLFEEQAIETIFKFFEFSAYPVFSLQRMPFQLIASYPQELAFLAFISALNLVIALMISVSIANYIFEKKSIIQSIIYSIKNLTKIIFLVLFFGLMIVLSLIILWAAFVFALRTGLLGAITLLLVTVLMGFIALHFFFVPALIGKGMKIKQALKESWNFSSKHFIQVTLVLLAIAIISSLINEIYWKTLSYTDSEGSAILIEFASNLITLTYINVLLPLFYLNKSK